jgi:hypothetical protein
MSKRQKYFYEFDDNWLNVGSRRLTNIMLNVFYAKVLSQQKFIFRKRVVQNLNIF